eukprot:jgi/Hompol1/1860/HPOL_005753-RA
MDEGIIAIGKLDDTETNLAMTEAASLFLTISLARFHLRKRSLASLLELDKEAATELPAQVYKRFQPTFDSWMALNFKDFISLVEDRDIAVSQIIAMLLGMLNSLTSSPTPSAASTVALQQSVRDTVSG